MSTMKIKPKALEAVMADKESGQQLHEPDEIRDFHRTALPELRGAKMAIGLTGSIYRVGVVDSEEVIHTLKIDPKSIDDDLAARARIKEINAGLTNKSAAPGKSKDHDHER